jgi:hypothetical protein
VDRETVRRYVHLSTDVAEPVCTLPALADSKPAIALAGNPEAAGGIEPAGSDALAGMDQANPSQTRSPGFRVLPAAVSRGAR